MKQFLYFLFFFIGSIQAYSQSVFTDSLTGIEISFITDENMFPTSWTDTKIAGKGKSLDSSEYERSRKIILRALSKYPKEILQSNLKKVYVLHHLSFYGVSYGGTNSSNVVYVTNKGEKLNYSDQYIEQVFHAELSSIFLRNFPNLLPENNWIRCHSLDFYYKGAGHEAIRNGKASEDYDSALNAEGFLNQYATSNFENDFNSFVKNIFAPDPEFWQVCQDHSNLYCKLEQTILFYQKLNPIFSKEYFKKWME